MTQIMLQNSAIILNGVRNGKKDYGIALDVARVRRIWIVGTYRDPSRPAHKAASSS